MLRCCAIPCMSLAFGKLPPHSLLQLCSLDVLPHCVCRFTPQVLPFLLFSLPLSQIVNRTIHAPRMCRPNRSPLPGKDQPHSYQTQPTKGQQDETKVPPTPRSALRPTPDAEIHRQGQSRRLHEPPCPPEHRCLPQDRRLLLRSRLAMLVLWPSIPAGNPTRAMAHQTAKLHGIPWLLHRSPRTCAIQGGHLRLLPNRQHQRRRLAPQNQLL